MLKTVIGLTQSGKTRGVNTTIDISHKFKLCLLIVTVYLKRGGSVERDYDSLYIRYLLFIIYVMCGRSIK